MNKSKSRVKRNLISGVLYQVILIAMGFLLPRLYLENFGSEVNGILSTIKQIFIYLFLLEAGVGLATTQALYKCVAEEDHKKTNSILSATKIYYRKTGIIYSLIILAWGVIYSFAVKTSVHPLVIFAIIVANALPRIFNYFIQAKYNILLEVDGRRYILNGTETIMQLASNILKILVVIFSDDLVLIQLAYCIPVILQLIFLYFYTKKNYSWLDLNEEPDFEAIGQKNSVLIHQISGMVFNNTDIILLSLLCDFKVVSVYTIYNIFFSQVQTFITSIISGFTFALGQTFQTNREKFKELYKAYEMTLIMSTFIIFTLMASFLLPLIQIYTGGINDAPYTNVLLLILFVIMSLMSNSKYAATQVIEFSGEFDKTRKYAIGEMIINISLSIIAIIYFGICGALMGTCAALLYRGITTIYYANKKVLGISTFNTYKHIILNGLVFLVVIMILPADKFSGASFLKLFGAGVLNAIWVVALFVIVNFVFNKNNFKTLVNLYRRNDK